jgi:hypothetical protein
MKRCACGLMLLAGLMAAGCPIETIPEKPKGGQLAQGADGQEMICETERPTGSSLSRRVCRPKESDTGTNRDQQLMQNMQRGGGQARGGGSH